MFKLYKKSVLQYIQYNRNTVWSHIHCPCSVVFTEFLPSKQNIWNYFTFHVYCVCTHSCYFFFEMFEMCPLSSSLWHFASCIGKKMDIVNNIFFSGASWTGWSFGPKENGHFRYLFKYLPILFMKNLEIKIIRTVSSERSFLKILESILSWAWIFIVTTKWDLCNLLNPIYWWLDIPALVIL